MLLEKPAVEVYLWTCNLKFPFLLILFFFLIIRPGPSQKFTAQFEPVYFKSLIQVLSIQCPSSQFLLTIHEKNLIIFIDKAKPICFSLLTLNHTRSFHILLAYPIPAHTGDWVHCVPPVPWYFHLSSRSEQALLSTSIFDLAKFKNLFFFLFNSTLYHSCSSVHIWTCYKIMYTYMSSPLVCYKFLEYQSTQNRILPTIHLHSINSHRIYIYLMGYIKFSLLFC